jgi:hypothetical protein
MRHLLRGVLRVAGIVAIPSVAALAQVAPKFGSMTTSRLLLLPAQEVTGTTDGRAWLARFDSVLTSRLEAGGIANGWAYPRDAIRYNRQNPTYTSDPRLMGVQPLKNEKIKDGFSLPEPFASRLRALLAVADARTTIVPVVARIDSTASPRTARLQLALVDGRLSRVLWTGTIEVRYEGTTSAAADSLAFMAARLFVAN